MPAWRFGAAKAEELEFAFLFNVGDYGSAPRGRISIEGLDAVELAFAAVDPKRELVATIDRTDHAALLKQMASGGKLVFDIGYVHRFSLNNAKPEIERTLAVCAGEIREKPVAAATGGDTLDRAPPASKTLLASPQTCHLKDSSAGAGGPRVTVNLTTPSAEVRTGDPITVAWKATGIDAKCRTPLFLVLTDSDAHALRGEKFLAVLPGPRVHSGYDISQPERGSLFPCTSVLVSTRGRSWSKPLRQVLSRLIGRWWRCLPT